MRIIRAPPGVTAGTVVPSSATYPWLLCHPAPPTLFHRVNQSGISNNIKGSWWKFPDVVRYTFEAFWRLWRKLFIFWKFFAFWRRLSIRWNVGWICARDWQIFGFWALRCWCLTTESVDGISILEGFMPETGRFWLLSLRWEVSSFWRRLNSWLAYWMNLGLRLADIWFLSLEMLMFDKCESQA